MKQREYSSLGRGGVGGRGFIIAIGWTKGDWTGLGGLL